MNVLYLFIFAGCFNEGLRLKVPPNEASVTLDGKDFPCSHSQMVFRVFITNLLFNSHTIVDVTVKIVPEFTGVRVVCHSGCRPGNKVFNFRLISSYLLWTFKSLIQVYEFLIQTYMSQHFSPFLVSRVGLFCPFCISKVLYEIHQSFTQRAIISNQIKYVLMIFALP